MSKNVLEYGLLSQFRVKKSNFQVFLGVPGKELSLTFKGVLYYKIDINRLVKCPCTFW